MDKRNLRWVLLTLLAIGMLLLAACSSPAVTPTTSSDDSAQVVEEEHEEGDDQEAEEHMEDDKHEEGDEHAEDEHAEDEHVEDEHEEGDEHAEDEHDEGDDHDDEHAHADVPHEFEDLDNPFAGDAASVAAGEELFGLYCASCHGETGMGDGPAAAGLDPQPASLADASMMSDVSDAYIYWRITEGGTIEPFNSAMPPWGEILDEDQRWQLVSFVRSLAE